MLEADAGRKKNGWFININLHQLNSTVYNVQRRNSFSYYNRNFILELFPCVIQGEGKNFFLHLLVQISNWDFDGSNGKGKFLIRYQTSQRLDYICSVQETEPVSSGVSVKRAFIAIILRPKKTITKLFFLSDSFPIYLNLIGETTLKADFWY